MTTNRNLVSVETITDIRPIPDADAIEQATVRGWTVVVKKGEFAPGDSVLYFEVDSALPLSDPRFEFLGSRGTKNIDGADYHVLKTAKLRGVYSQGLVLPFRDFKREAYLEAYRGPSLSESLGIFKYEPPVPANLAGQIKGAFPTHIAPKTDEERIQNMANVINVVNNFDSPETWIATEKIDGTSATVYVVLGADEPTIEFGVASRNWDISPDENNTLWRVTGDLELHDSLIETMIERQARFVAIQGEVFGEGIQGNPLGMKGQHFRAFSLYVDNVEVPRGDWPDRFLELAVPIHDLDFPTLLEQALEQADRTSLVSPGRKIEGLVWRNTQSSTLPDGERASFKVISNKYLLKHDR